MSDEFERKVFEVEVDYHPDTGAILTERWKNQFGQFDRLADLPAVTEYCPTTGSVTYQRWHQSEFPQGPHRDGDKPARVTIDPNTGTQIQIDYMKLGHHHRDGDKPAEIIKRESGTDEEHAYWQFGKRHRPPQDGPAVIRFDDNGNVSKTEYWFNDQRVQPPNPQRSMDILG